MRIGLPSLLVLPLLALPLGLVVPACGGTVNPGTPDAGADANADAVADVTADASPPPPPPPLDAGPDVITPTPSAKLDLLFMIDNSSSMGEKQQLFAQAAPELVARLLNPRCLDANDPTKVVGVSSNGACATGVIEFKPVHDLHIAVVSSALGGRGGDICVAGQKNPVNPALDAHNDDQGHLLSRGTASEQTVTDTQPSGFLAWFPSVPENQGQPPPPVPAIGDGAKLAKDFNDLLTGVDSYGCGFEAQLESWYRFLVQPDPYLQIVTDSATPSKKKLDGVDATILQQRRAFLRPDSAVAVVLLTDENERSVDPMALDGQGFAFESTAFPGSTTGSAPKPTSACATDPNAPTCTSCAFAQSDPACNPVYYSPADDDLNVRFFHMKQRFGIDPQFPVARYVRGLSLPKVPDRNGEHTAANVNYLGEQNAKCTNPLFAASLPGAANDELCNLPTGTRSPSQVFFMVIGGVPHQLLQVSSADPNSPQKATLSDADWVRILGKNPSAYDFTGADPHMYESIAPRPGLPGPNAPDTADPISGREWDTKKGNLQYACVFPVAAPKDCAAFPGNVSCDCGGGATPPLCDPANPNTQIRLGAHPSIRELDVARQLGGQAIVSSICPIHATEASPGDPLYGYRPAVSALIDRLRGVLAK